jgi:hypothetical protein
VDDAEEAWYSEQEPEVLDEALRLAWIYSTASPWNRFSDEFDQQLMERVLERRDQFIERWRYDHGDLEVGDDPLDLGDVRDPESISDLFCDNCETLNWRVGVKGEAHYCTDCWESLDLADQSGLSEVDPSRLPDRYVLVGCGAAKNSGKLEAREKYSNSYFAKKRDFAEELGDRWWIVSAKYGVVQPDRVIDDYDLSIEDVDVDGWLPRVEAYLENETPVLDDEDSETWVLLGQKYLDAESSSGRSLRDVLDSSSTRVRYPFEETSGIGEQNQYLDLVVEAGKARMPSWFDEFQEPDEGQSELSDF